MFRSEREEVAFVCATENQSAGSGKYTCPRRGLQPEFPRDAPRSCFQRANSAPLVVGWKSLLAAACKKRSRFEIRFALVVSCSHFADSHVEQSGLRTVRRAEPDRRAIEIRPHQL